MREMEYAFSDWIPLQLTIAAVARTRTLLPAGLQYASSLDTETASESVKQSEAVGGSHSCAQTEFWIDCDWTVLIRFVLSHTLHEIHGVAYTLVCWRICS